jgi:hypothetical protein
MYPETESSELEPDDKQPPIMGGWHALKCNTPIP